MESSQIRKAAVISLAVIFLTGPHAWSGIDVYQVHGDAEVVRAMEAESARRKMQLEKGDQIITGQNESVDIQWGSLWTCRLLPNSRASITGTSLQDQRVEVSEGGMLFRFRKMPRKAKFELSGPVSVAAVRGTTFLMTTQKNSDTYALLEGSLEIFDEQRESSTMLSESQAVEVRKDGSHGGVRPVNKEESALLLEAKSLRLKRKTQNAPY